MDIKELQVNVEKETANNHPWEFARAKVVKNILKKHLRSRKQDLCVADVGCGDVFFLNQFWNSYPHCKPIAVDTAFDEEIINNLSNKHQKMHISFFKDVAEIQLADNAIDVVFLMDVIEHIENDVEFVQGLSERGFVNKDTLFMVTVPAFNSLYCSHDKWLGHYRRYDIKMLKQHLKSAGLECVEGGYFFTTLLLPRWIQKKLESPEKMDEEVTGIGGWNGGKMVSKFYEWALLCDFYFFRFFRIFGLKFPGLSTYALCKRQS